MGYPVVMKIAGPKILHKTDVGGVKLNLADEESVRTTYATMVRPSASGWATTSRSGAS
jgi:acyl-CoA synthetase (NDP forming)